MADGSGPGCISPVCARPLRRQLHPIHRVVAVVVHDLRQAKVCDLDLAARCAVHQQDVACGRATNQNIPFLNPKRNKQTCTKIQFESCCHGDPPGFRSQWMMGGLISLRYLSALTICMMMERPSFSDMSLCCFRQKSKSLPSQYSSTVQNLHNQSPLLLKHTCRDSKMGVISATTDQFYSAGL